MIRLRGGGVGRDSIAAKWTQSVNRKTATSIVPLRLWSRIFVQLAVYTCEVLQRQDACCCSLPTEMMIMMLLIPGTHQQGPAHQPTRTLNPETKALCPLSTLKPTRLSPKRKLRGKWPESGSKIACLGLWPWRPSRRTLTRAVWGEDEGSLLKGCFAFQVRGRDFRTRF